MKKINRIMKVYEQSGYHYKPTPTITLKGAWLEDWGFKIDTPIIVQCEQGRLVIIKKEPEEGNNHNKGCSHEI
ncbi:MAG: type I toxin-antitoxin system SymE family toxin [Ruminococcus flavefaciens]|nr:type I toxin-antitoxin system SymE family toxin [Ruminococcus flavefaciens]